MRSIAAALLLLASCGRAEQGEFNQAKFDREGEELNQHLAELNGELAPEIPNGWHYTVRRDQIRNYDQRLATLPSEDRTATIAVQSWFDSPPTVIFRTATMVGFRCVGECSVAVSIDGRQDVWGGYSHAGETIVIHNREAVAAIRSGQVVIAELPMDGDPQKTFRVAGLRWRD